ncbi:hypothetical protein [Glycomyces niveus]|uniref:Uncharacterized protein n=1 Tax=Glycomyces niveus TaxID=2820287 RepID=A0ABS3U4G4_9ACTN|nr:hypothetical protein [Glycomyces sp. NEAU-S30]MBO3733662.1 hypothetical protein [Glycomyces sp. NEAU-S30]
MSATPPYGPAYDEQPEDGQRPGTGQWRPRAGRPQGAQGEPGPYQSGPRAGGPQAGGPTAGGPQGGQRPLPQAGRPSQDPRGGAPRGGGPSAGRGPQQGGQGGFQSSGQGQSPQQPGQGYAGHQSPQQQFSPQYGGYESRRPQGPVTGATPRAERQDQWGAGSPPRAGSPSQPPQGAGAPQAKGPGGEPLSRKEQPFEETAFADESRGEWGGGSETTTIGRLGYMPKEPRRRSDFQKVRSRARKSSPIPKIIGGVVALALVGGGVWWFMNRDDGSETTGGTETNLTFEGSSEPCSLVDAGPLEAVVNGAEPTAVGDAQDKSRGWVQTCSMTYGEAERATALLEVESTVFDSDAKASVNFELGTSDIGELGEAWTLVEPAPEIGDQSAAVSRVPEDGGTSNFHLHVQDDNTYTVVRLSVAEDAGMDQQGLTDLALAIANGYLANWRDAS